MSSKLVLEFYDLSVSHHPTACVLACHGGDNPSQAATTLTDFFAQLAGISDPRFEDAGLLAARFVAWEGQRGSNKTLLDFLDVSIIPAHGTHGCQIVRIYAGHQSLPHVEFMRDQYTTAQEMDEADSIMGGVSKSIVP